MIFNNSKLCFKEIENVCDFKSDDKYTNIFIGICGFENRTNMMIQEIHRNMYKYEIEIGIIFNEYRDLNETIRSKKIYEKYNTDLFEMQFGDIENEIPRLIQKILQERSSEKNLNINIDISGMPRYFYCSLPIELGKYMKDGDKLKIWYVPGEYVESEFPTAGISKLVRFSGKPSLQPQKRAHILGLGFDSIRSEGMLTVLDPSYLITYYSNPSVNESYTDRIQKDNKEIIDKSKLVIPMNIFDCESSLSKLVSMVHSLMDEFEVVIVPDGPKIFILLSSLIPEIINCEGVICLHINSNRKKKNQYIDVNAIGKPIGILFSKEQNCLF